MTKALAAKEFAFGGRPLKQPLGRIGLPVEVLAKTGGRGKEGIGLIESLLQGGRPFLNNLLKLVDVATVGPDDGRPALDLPMSDVEDAFQAAAAVAWKADVIITSHSVVVGWQVGD